jgi:hypothetical protein
MATHGIGHGRHAPPNAKNPLLTFVLPSRLVEEANDLASNVLSPGLLMVHDTGRGGEDNVAELTGGQQLDNPLLEIGEADVVAGGDDTGLVEAAARVNKSSRIMARILAESTRVRHGHNIPAVELNDNLARAVVVDFLELADEAY